MNWSDEDRTAALDWIDWLASLCSGCGNPKVECMDDANEGRYEAIPVTCYACAVRDAEQRTAAERVDTADNRKPGGIDRSSLDGTFIAVVEKGRVSG